MADLLSCHVYHRCRINSNRQRAGNHRKGRVQNEILMQSGVWKIIMELHYETIKPKDRRQYRAGRGMDGRDQIFHILNPADLLISISMIGSPVIAIFSPRSFTARMIRI